MDTMELNIFDGETQKDIFGDLQEKAEFRRLERKNNMSDYVKVDVINRSSTRIVSSFVDTTPITSTANTKLNEQFFVWKGGQVGRMSVDTPFGFKSI